ncbi:hypothetical protein ABWH96_20535 [Marivirga tractuosa]|uniref:toxin-antitoxin system YwqK family antitoxin n=1 Tax=Marivirga tractuosa TaxID=1006 RepID=UPI0035D03D70
MDKKTKIKVTLITIVGLIVAYIYFNRIQLIDDLKFVQRQNKWEKEKPKGQLINGRKNGEWTTYFKNGQLASIENYKEDTLHGTQIYYTPKGLYKLKANYYNGIKVDSFLMYTVNGTLNFEEFRDSMGRRQGLFKVYDSNGQITQIGEYKDGEFNGEFRTFFNTGQLKTIKNYKLGAPTGRWIELSETGDTIKVEQK